MTTAIPSIARLPVDIAKHRLACGTPVILRERCKECRFCIELCPKDVLILGATFNRKGYRSPQVAMGKEEACIACRFCEQVCPDFAIYIENKVA